MANIGMTFTSGNTEKDTTHFDGEFSARTEKNRYTAGGQLNRSEDNGIKTESNSLGYLKYDHFLSEKWFAYANSLFEKDRFKDLNLRSALGVGIGHQFFETAETNLSLESGLNYVSDDYIVAPDESYSSGRWAINYDKYFFSKAFQFFHFHEGFVSLEDSEDMFIKSRTGIRVPIYKRLNASLQYNLDWEKSPSPGREKTDKVLMFTLGYMFEN
jgi:putative salt-induced outer membrane protein YdiY